jgi:hypothetical protein
MDGSSFGVRQERIVDRNRFDNLSRAMAKRASRRGMIAFAGRAIAAAIGLGTTISPRVGADSAEAASCRDGAVSCTSNGQCCSGECGPKDSRGRRRCTCAEPEFACGLSCCQPGEVCENGACKQPEISPNVCTTTLCGNCYCVSFADGTYGCGAPPYVDCEDTCRSDADCGSGTRCSVASTHPGYPKYWSELCPNHPPAVCLPALMCEQ